MWTEESRQVTNVQFWLKYWGMYQKRVIFGTKIKW